MNDFKRLEERLADDMLFSAHDADVIQVKIAPHGIIVRYALNECNYLWARDIFADFWKNQKNILIIDQIFSDTEIIRSENNGLDFCFSSCAVDEFDRDKHTFFLMLVQDLPDGTDGIINLNFKFKNVKYRIQGEFSREQFDEMMDSVENPDCSKWHRIFTIEDEEK
jgi:hypothetical protein